MRWSMPLGRVFGIRIRLHATFLLLLVWVGWLGWYLGGGSGSVWALVLVNCLFVCVVLHELGHSVMAMQFGVEVESITLLPIGGVAGMKSIPEHPGQEFLISVCGPLVNVVIALLLTLVRGGFPHLETLPELPGNVPELVDVLILTNVVLVIFNLIPAFPMDGGRVLRSFLAWIMPFARATTIAATVGQVLAAGFIVLGLWKNPLLALIGVFVFFGAEGEDRRVRTKTRLKGFSAEDVMRRQFRTLQPDDALEQCLALAHDYEQEDFPVTAEGLLVGLLPKKTWLQALHGGDAGQRVADVMHTRFVSVYPKSDLAQLYPELAALEQGVFPVLYRQSVVGLLDLDDVRRMVSGESGGSRRGREGQDRASGQGARSRFAVDLG